MTNSTPGGGGGIGEAAKELLQEMQKAQAEAQQLEGLSQKGPNQAFQAAMQQAEQVSQVSEVTAAQQAREAQKATHVLLRAQANAGIQTTAVGSAAQEQNTKLAGMIQNLIRGQDRMNEIMNMALSGRAFSPPELIAMQAGVYRFTQELELTSKIVEKATSGIKQTMNTQV